MIGKPKHSTARKSFESQIGTGRSSFVNYDNTPSLPRISDVTSVPLKQINNRDPKSLKNMNSQKKSNSDFDKFRDDESQSEDLSKKKNSDGQCFGIGTFDHRKYPSTITIKQFKGIQNEGNENIDTNVKCTKQIIEDSFSNHQHLSPSVGKPNCCTTERGAKWFGPAKDDYTSNNELFPNREEDLKFRRNFQAENSGSKICTNCGFCNTEKRAAVSTSEENGVKTSNSWSQTPTRLSFSKTSNVYLAEDQGNSISGKGNEDQEERSVLCVYRRTGGGSNEIKLPSIRHSELGCSSFARSFLKVSQDLDRYLHQTGSCDNVKNAVLESNVTYENLGPRYSEAIAISTPTRRGSKVKYTPLKHGVSFQRQFPGKMHAMMHRISGHDSQEDPSLAKRAKFDDRDGSNIESCKINPVHCDQKRKQSGAERGKSVSQVARDHLPTNTYAFGAFNKQQRQGSFGPSNTNAKEEASSSNSTCCESESKEIPSGGRSAAKSSGTSDQQAVMKNSIMTPSEMVKFLNLNPSKSVDFAFQEIPPDRLQLLISKIQSQKRNCPIALISTRESFVKEIKDVLHRISLDNDKRLEDKNVRDMIMLAQSYLARYEDELRAEGSNFKTALRNDTSERIEELSDAQQQTIGCNESSSNSVEYGNHDQVDVVSIKSSDVVKDLGVNASTGDYNCNVISKGHESIDDLRLQENPIIAKKQRAKKTKIKAVTFSNETAEEYEVCLRDTEFPKRDSKSVCSETIMLEEVKKAREKDKVKDSEMVESMDLKEKTEIENREDCGNHDSATIVEKGASTSRRKSNGRKKSMNNEKTRSRKVSSGNLIKEEKASKEKCNKDFVTKKRKEKEEVPIDIAVKPCEITSQEKIIVADALLSLGECKPAADEVSAILESFRDAITEFSLAETSKFFRNRFRNLEQGEKKARKSYYNENLKSLRREMEAEYSRKIERAVTSKKADIDLKLSYELAMMSQHFRQELWIRIQKCICGKVGQLSCCSRCCTVYYCSKKCQVLDSNEHKLICKVDDK